MTESVGGAERLLTRSFVLLGVCELGYFLTAAGLAMHVLPLYVTGPVGSDEAGAGLAFGAFGITALVCRPWAGRVADTIGRRPLLIGGALVAAAGMVALAFTQSLAVIFAIRLAQGVAEGVFVVAAFAMLADIAPPARIGEALSYNSLGLYLGIALGPIVGELARSQWGFDGAWIAAALLLVASAALAIGIDAPYHHEAGADRGTLIHRPAIPPALGFLASLIAMGGFLTFASLHAAAVDLPNTSLLLFSYGTVVVICRVAFARVPDRLPALPLGAASLVAIAVGLLVVAGWPSPAGAFLGAAVMAVGVAFSTPSFFRAIFETASPSRRGAASATATACIDLGLGIGPIALGVVAGEAGIPMAMVAGAGVALAGAAWTLSLARRTP